MKKIILFSFFLFTSSYIMAQSNGENELGVWYMYAGNFKVAEKYTIKSTIHSRMFNVGDDLQQLLVRHGLNYKINNTLSATLGHAYLLTDTTFDESGGGFHEHRIYEDFNIKHQISDLGFAHRLMLEHRFLPSTTRHWLRYQLSLSHPISEKWATYLFDEIFFNFDGESFAQNWLGLGLKYKLSDKVLLNAGYQKITMNTSNFDRLRFGVALNFDFRKKES